MQVIKVGSENLFMVVNVEPKREIESPKKIKEMAARKCGEAPMQRERASPRLAQNTTKKLSPHFVYMQASPELTVFSNLSPPSQNEQNLDFNTYIKEWLDLENVMLWDYDKPILEGTSRDKSGNIIAIVGDECFQIDGFDKAACEQKEKCKVYKSSSGSSVCTEEQHLKYTYVSSNPSNPNTYKSLSRRTYTVIQSGKILDNDAFNTASQGNAELFFKIFKSESTKNIYVLFSSGVVFDVSTMSDKFATIITEILSYQDYNKIVIGGHSMGCMIALHFANAVFRNPDNRQFFFDKCIVLGSGPYRGYHYDDPLPNTKIFVSTFIKQREPPVLNVDGYFFRSSGDLSKHYDPVVFINTDDNALHFVEDVEKMAASLDSSLHMFQHYSSFLKKMLEENRDFNKVDGSKDITDAVINKLSQNVSHKMPTVVTAAATVAQPAPKPTTFMPNQLLLQLQKRKPATSAFGGNTKRKRKRGRKSLRRKRVTKSKA